MLTIATRRQTALLGLAFVAVSAMASAAAAGQGDTPSVVVQPSEPTAGETPPGRVERPDGTARPTAARPDTPEPLSERAAAAAARAKRALSEEDGGQFDGNTPTQTELVIADEPAAAAPAAAGQPISDEQKRRSAANLQPPSQRAAAQPSATCIAGCY